MLPRDIMFDPLRVECPQGAEECSLAFHEDRPLAALTWVAQQPRKGAARSRADEEANQLADVAATYADRCEHVLGSSDRMPGGAVGASAGGIGGRSSEYGSTSDDGFALLQVQEWMNVAHIFAKRMNCSILPVNETQTVGREAVQLYSPAPVW